MPCRQRNLLPISWSQSRQRPSKRLINLPGNIVTRLRALQRALCCTVFHVRVNVYVTVECCATQPVAIGCRTIGVIKTGDMAGSTPIGGDAPVSRAERPATGWLTTLRPGWVWLVWADAKEAAPGRVWPRWPGSSDATAGAGAGMGCGQLGVTGRGGAKRYVSGTGGTRTSGYGTGGARRGRCWEDRTRDGRRHDD